MKFPSSGGVGVVNPRKRHFLLVLSRAVSSQWSEKHERQSRQTLTADGKKLASLFFNGS